MQVLATFFRGIWSFLGNDSKLKHLLGFIAVTSYFGGALLGLSMVMLGNFAPEDAQRFLNSWTLCIGPITGAVIGYYFSRTMDTVRSPSEKGLLALFITLFFFIPPSVMAYLVASERLDIASFRKYLELWILFSGPITGMVFGFYFNAVDKANTNGDSDEK